jgi:glycosyltransferase involved in cell wall biosynthesis
MKVLNVCSNFDPITGGGEAERSFQLSQFLIKSGVPCRLLTIDTGLSEQRINCLGAAAVIALPCWARRFYVPKVSLRHIRQLVDESDVVHLIGHWTILNALIYLAIRKAGKPYVVCPAGALTIFGRSKILKKIYNLTIGNKIIRNASACIAVTADESLSFISFGVAAEKIQVIPNGIAATDFASNNVDHFRRKYGLGTTPFALFVGRLNLIKGPDLLVQAFCNLRNRVDNFDLVLVGPDGGMQDHLKALVRDAGLSKRVHFIGYLGGAEKSDAYHSAELLVIPSRHEAMSIVALEAGTCGTPVLLTDQCGFDQLSEVGGGWLVPASVAGLEAGLLEIIQHPNLLRPAALSIKKYVAENFEWDIVIKKYMILYMNLTMNSTEK